MQSLEKADFGSFKWKITGRNNFSFGIWGHYLFSNEVKNYIHATTEGDILLLCINACKSFCAYHFLYYFLVCEAVPDYLLETEKWLSKEIISRAVTHFPFANPLFPYKGNLCKGNRKTLSWKNWVCKKLISVCYIRVTESGVGKHIP